jgi:hypothetical protein
MDTSRLNIDDLILNDAKVIADRNRVIFKRPDESLNSAPTMPWMALDQKSGTLHIHNLTRAQAKTLSERMIPTDKQATSDTGRSMSLSFHIDGLPEIRQFGAALDKAFENKTSRTEPNGTPDPFAKEAEDIALRNKLTFKVVRRRGTTELTYPAAQPPQLEYNADLHMIYLSNIGGREARQLMQKLSLRSKSSVLESKDRETNFSLLAIDAASMASLGYFGHAMNQVFGSAHKIVR